jgi:hypothetical protein
MKAGGAWTKQCDYRLMAWIVISVYTWSVSQSHATIRTVSEFVGLGQRESVWGTLCVSSFCSGSFCFEIKSRNGQPATAKVSVETSLHKTNNTVETGSYCTDSKWMTYFMTMTVYVEPVSEDVYVIYNKFVGQ